MNCVLCASGREALHLMDKFESSLEILIIVANDSKFEEVKSRYSSKVSIYLFEELMVISAYLPIHFLIVRKERFFQIS